MEGMLPSSRRIGLCVLLGVLIVGWMVWRNYSQRPQPSAGSLPAIEKQPAIIANRTFDPGAPPADMPPQTPGENAACDSNFLSSASVGGETKKIDATHATVTISKIKVTLQLNITIWVPTGVSQHVIEHEDGHRQISEFYYQTADKVAERIAATYMGKQFSVAGTDLSAEADKILQQWASEIADEYSKELNPGPTQQLFDTITDHSRNEVAVKDAVAAAIKNVAIAPN
jgi:hypothetical protein